MHLNFQISQNDGYFYDAVIYMYCDQKSFKWVIDAAWSSETTVKFLIGNKSDIEIREVDMETGQDFAQANGMMFTEISAKEGKKIQMVLRMLRSKLSNDSQED